MRQFSQGAGRPCPYGNISVNSLSPHPSLKRRLGPAIESSLIFSHTASKQEIGRRSGFLTRKQHREAGFTLIELMIVLFILGLLAALVAPRLMGRVGEAKQKTAQAQL
jgi:prepilin-type N-terminal cleavage/methylation domain-containing protein